MVHIEKCYFTLQRDRSALGPEHGRSRLHGGERRSCACRCGCTAPVSRPASTSATRETANPIGSRSSRPGSAGLQDSDAGRVQDLPRRRSERRAFRRARRRLCRAHGAHRLDLRPAASSWSSVARNGIASRPGTGSAGHTVADGIAFQHDADYRNVRLGSTEMALGRGPGAGRPARCTRLRSTDRPWLDGKRLLAEAGATSMRMSDVFKSKKRLARSDRFGPARAVPAAARIRSDPARRGADIPTRPTPIQHTARLTD